MVLFAKVKYLITFADTFYFFWLQVMGNYLVYVRETGGDSSSKGCFGRKTNLFRESGDFAGNRETWEMFREI